MSEVGALIIRLQAETAQFRQDMGKVKGDLNDLKDGADKTGPSFERAAGGAGGIRTQLGLLDNVIRGAHAQAMADLVRKFSDSALVMQILPIAATGAAFVLMGGLIYEAAHKMEAWSEAAKTAAQANRVLADSEDNTTRSLEVANLKLEDQIAKLQKRPTTNGLREALLENQTAVVTMADKFDEQFKKVKKSIESSSGAMGEFVQSMKNFGSDSVSFFGAVLGGLEQDASWFNKYILALDEINSLLPGTGKAMKDAFAFNDAAAQLSTASNNVKDAEEKLSTLKGALDDAPVNKLKEATSAYANELRNVINYLNLEKAAMAEQPTQDATKNAAIDQEIQSRKAQLKDLGLEQRREDLENRKAEEENAKVAAEATKKANIEKIRSWDAVSNAAQKYKGTLEQQQAADAKHARSGPSPAELAAIAAIDPILARTLDDSKKVGTELGQWSSYLNQVAASEKAVANAQSQANATAQLEAIDQQIQAYQELYDKGLITQSRLVKDLKPLYQQETDTKLEAIRAEINEQQSLVMAAQKSGDAVKANTAIAAEIRLQTQLEQIKRQGVAKQHALDIQQQADFQRLCNQSTSAFNDAIAKQIVMGGNLAQSMRMVGANMLEDVIKYAMKETVVKVEQWGIQKAMSLIFHNPASEIASDKSKAVSAAGLAGANAVASFAAAPWPIDMGAPAFGASMMADALGMAAFEQGGKIPGAGAVPILGHGGETVVTKALTDRVEATEGRGAGKGDTHIHNTFAPQIHAFDSEGVDRVLATHSAKFQRHITSVVRRMNK